MTTKLTSGISFVDLFVLNASIPFISQKWRLSIGLINRYSIESIRDAEK